LIGIVFYLNITSKINQSYHIASMGPLNITSKKLMFFKSSNLHGKVSWDLCL